MTSWYTQPFITAGLISGIRPDLFNVRGVSFAAWTLVAFMIAALAGAVVKRTIPAMASALAVCAGLMFATALWIRPHYQDPLTGSASAITVKWWVVGTARAGAAVTYQPDGRFWHFQLMKPAGWSRSRCCSAPPPSGWSAAAPTSEADPLAVPDRAGTTPHLW